MTNLLAAIFFTVTTNWTTLSLTSPVIEKEQQYNLVYYPTMANQQGVVTSNTMARIVWPANTAERLEVVFCLRSVELRRIHRSVDANRIAWGEIKCD